VIDLGIKVPPERLIAAVREHAPDAIGLSGLLVKSAQQMEITAGDLRRAGISLPLLVGGAALSPAFVERKIAPAYGGPVAYAKDAMSGLDLARRLVERKEAPPEPARPIELPANVVAARRGTKRSAEVRPLDELPRPPDLDRHVLRELPLDLVWRHVNPMMLYGRHLGLKGQIVRHVEQAPEAELRRTETGRKALELRGVVDEVKAACRDGAMHVRAVYRFVRALPEGNDVHLLSPDGERLGRFTFERQQREAGLCLADLLAPAGDTLGLFVVTAGEGIRARAEALKARGQYLRSHVLQALALETAEAAAEYLHAELRSLWGFPDPPGRSLLDLFRANYRGKRYSFGYPACPALEDQRLLFQVLRPEEIGVQLTDGCMMDPEASVSALVFHHPDATYFSVEPVGNDAAPEAQEVAR